MLRSLASVHDSSTTPANLLPAVRTQVLVCTDRNYVGMIHKPAMQVHPRQTIRQWDSQVDIS
jgi:hypothetical protein